MTPRPLRTALHASLALLLAGAASAQSFNLDVGGDFGSPGSAYGAAAGQAGAWHLVDAGSPGVSIPLSDTSGAATAVTVSYTLVGNGLGNFSFNNAATSGDDQALLDDLLDIGNGSQASETVWTFAGLADGPYAVYTYHFGADLRTAFSTDAEVLGGAAGVQVCGNAAWTGAHVHGGTFVQDTVTVSGGSLQIRFTSRGLSGNFGSLNGIQLTPGAGCAAPSTYCTAKVSSSGCTPAIGSSGSNSASAGTFAVTASAIEGGQLGVVFWGGAPAAQPFQGGFLCVQPPVQRLPVQSSGGTLGSCDGSYAQPAAAAVLSALGAGNTAWFQVWFRDPGAASGTGLSDALEVPVCP